jgi:hypothetical protein
LRAVLTGDHLTAQARYELPYLLPQILSGHRLWARATKKRERFIALNDLEFWHQPTNGQLWLRLYLYTDDLSRLGVTHKRLLSESDLASSFHEVSCSITVNGRNLICLEQNAPIIYTGNYPADFLTMLVAEIKQNLLSTVSTVPPYRRYYIYLCPPTEVSSLLPQLLSIYAVTYYLGSITRYRPHHFDAIAGGHMGHEFRISSPVSPFNFCI